jgi:glycosyltransferase involved in cell wall biosynthesis
MCAVERIDGRVLSPEDTIIRDRRRRLDMNVAFVSNVVYPFVKGGAEKRIHEIGRRLAASGHEVTVYARKYWTGSERREHEGMVLQAVAPEAELHSGDRRSIAEAVDFAARLLPSLRGHLADRDHDLMIVSVFPYFPVLTSKLASLGRDVPLVTTWHEVWRSYWDDYLGRLAPFGKLVERTTARVPQRPIAVSGVTADRLASIGPDRERIDVVHNGLDTEQVRQAPLPDDPADGYDVLFAGRLMEHKNVDVLLSAFDRVAVRHGATLGIVGDGPERERLRSRAAKLNVADRIDFLGFLEEYEQVLGQMRAADVFVSPSTREGFGITFVEAMAADCTVIAADHPHSAAAEVIADAGYLTEPTVDALVDRLDRALGGERPRGDPCDRAARYDWSNIAARAEDVYRRALVEG